MKMLQRMINIHVFCFSDNRYKYFSSLKTQLKTDKYEMIIQLLEYFKTFHWMEKQLVHVITYFNIDLIFPIYRHYIPLTSTVWIYSKTRL